MSRPRLIGRLLLALLLYLTLCVIAGVFVADAALRPARRPLTQAEISEKRGAVASLNATVADVSITTPDHVLLRAWLLQPNHEHRNAVLLLHGLGDNRVGMMGYAYLLLANGFEVLLPDARAHGISGGQFATYGLLEQDDIHQWLDFLEAGDHPHCIFGFGESMGASQLLESLTKRPKFCAVVAESPFANFREIAYDRMGQPFHAGPWLGRTLLRPVVEIAFLRARWKYGFDMRKVSPEKAVSESAIAVLLIHGQIDSNIPVRHSRAIHALAPRTQLWEVPDADHCGAISKAPEEFSRRLLAWFSDTSRAAGSWLSISSR